MRGFQKSLLPLTSSKILSFGKTQIHLVFRSLNRIIDIRLRYFRSTIQKKRVSFWYCPRLIVSLQAEQGSRAASKVNEYETFREI